jgi:hypothetical protein
MADNSAKECCSLDRVYSRFYTMVRPLVIGCLLFVNETNFKLHLIQFQPVLPWPYWVPVVRSPSSSLLVLFSHSSSVYIKEAPITVLLNSSFTTNPWACLLVFPQFATRVTEKSQYRNYPSGNIYKSNDQLQSVNQRHSDKDVNILQCGTILFHAKFLGFV